MKRGREKYDDAALPVFVTTTVTNHINVFDIAKLAEDSLRLLEQIRLQYQMRIYCYCLMPNHIHLITQSSNKGDLSNFMRVWKSLSARQVLKYAENHCLGLLSEFRKSAEVYGLSMRQARQVWMPRFDDLQLRNSEVAITKINYIHENPVRKRIVEHSKDYPYSSAAWYNGMSRGYVKLTDIKGIL